MDSSKFPSQPHLLHRREVLQIECFRIVRIAQPRNLARCDWPFILTAEGAAELRSSLAFLMTIGLLYAHTNQIRRSELQVVLAHKFCISQSVFSDFIWTVCRFQFPAAN